MENLFTNRADVEPEILACYFRAAMLAGRFAESQTMFYLNLRFRYRRGF